MNSIQEQIALLTVRIQDLTLQQDAFKAKLIELTRELEVLKARAAATESVVQENKAAAVKPAPEEKQTAIPVIEAQPPVISAQPAAQTAGTAEVKKVIVPPKRPAKPASEKSSGLEEFLGKNLASKVGILVTVIGIFIGAKYAIEHDLISEQVRILLGYLAGAILVGLAYKLKNKYAGYSAVLMGGGLCVLYFITYIAWSYYHLLPRMAAFGIMVGVTLATVYAATMYNRVIIAHLGLVGAYAIPFLLSNNSGNYIALFTYITIINAGIVVVSFMKYWKSLTWSAFGLTWFIFGFWAMLVHDERNFNMVAWLFVSIFAALFYITLLGYKLLKREAFNITDLFLLFPNSFIFYLGGMGLLENVQATDWQEGNFTLLNAAIHLGVAMLVRRITGAASPLFSILIGLVVTFIVIAVPVYFEGVQVTLVWAVQSVILYVMARRWNVKSWLYFSIITIVMAWFNLLNIYLLRTVGDQFTHTLYFPQMAFRNAGFRTVVLVLLVTAALLWLHHKRNAEQSKKDDSLVHAFFQVLLPLVAILAFYGSVMLEFWRYFENISVTLGTADGSFGPWLTEVHLTDNITRLLFTFVYLLLLMMVNHRWFRIAVVTRILLVAFIITSVIWMGAGLNTINELAIHYFSKGGTGMYFGVWGLLCRYAIAAVMAALMYLFQPRFNEETNTEWMNNFWCLLLVLLTVVFLSFEYLLWTSVSGANRQYTYGLSVVWGLYALALIIYGIWKKHRIFRLAAMVLLVVTLIKLVFFDLRHANTLTRTITYIALGGILLLISYLYNRYKELLFGDDKQEEEH